MNKNKAEEETSLYPIAPKIRECECGYIPNKWRNKDNKCRINLPLLNHISYPSLKMIPHKDEIKELFYDQDNGDPKFHWCILIEIKQKINCNNWWGFTSFGEKLDLEIQQEEQPTTFDSNEIKSDNTVGIFKIILT